MTVQTWAGILFVVGAVVLAAAFVWVARRASRGPDDYGEIYPKVSLVRRTGFGALAVVAVLAFGFSIPHLPYPGSRAAVGSTGEPMTVEVVSGQWQWQLSIEPAQVPVGRQIRFEVTSQDVNHGFAIISPGGSVVGQVQAMPGYTNVLYVTFDEPGTYTVRCLEYCGIGHTAMVFPDFEVVAAG